MEKRKPSIWQIITLILLVICLFQTMALREQIQNFSNNTNTKISDLQYQINNISGNITSTLEQEASQLSYESWNLGNADMEAGTVDLNCELLPKEYSEEATEVVLVYDGDEYQLQYENGSYRGIIPISIFEDTAIENVIMRENGSTRTEQIGWYISPRYDYLPMVYADMSSSFSEYHKGSTYIMEYTGDVNVSIDVKGEQVKPEKAYFYVCMNDEEIKRVDITEELAYSFEEKYEIPFGSELTFYVEVVDEHNLHHRTIVERIIIDKSGSRQYDEKEFYWRGAVASVYDENGKLLHSEYEL